MDPEVYISAILSISLIPILAVSLRLYLILRRGATQRFWTTAAKIQEGLFATMLVLWIAVSIMQTVLLCEEIKYQKAGDRSEKAKKKLWALVFKLAYIELLAWKTTMWAIKGAFMCIYFDMTQFLPRYISRIIYGTCCLLAASWVASMTISSASCLPVKRNWAVDDDFCSPHSTLGVTASLHLTTNFLVFIIPILIFRIVRVQRRERLALIFVFICGNLTMAAAIITAVLRVYARKAAVAARYSENYITVLRYENEKVRLSVVIECSAAIFVLCLPSFRALLRKKHDESLGSREGRGHGDVMASYQSENNASEEAVRTSMGKIDIGLELGHLQQETTHASTVSTSATHDLLETPLSPPSHHNGPLGDGTR